MLKRAASRQQGFSFVELLIGLAIFLLVLLAVYQVFDTGTATYRSGQVKADVQQNARVALDELVRQLRMAGYYPENFDTDGTNDLLLSANNQKIQVATTGGLAVRGDLDGTCNPTAGPCPANSSSVFLYCVETDKPNRKVYLRRKKGATGAAASYQCTAGAGSDILAELADLTYRRDSDTIIDNTAWMTVTYYDANNALIPVPTANPKGLDGVVLGSDPDPAVMFASTTNRTTVRTVVVTLILREDTVQQQQNPQIYSLTSSIRLRNLN